MDVINLDEFLRANESQIRWAVESLVLGRVTEAIGKDNLGKVMLSLQGSTLGDWAVHVEGPDHLKARIEEALRRLASTASDPCSPCLHRPTMAGAGLGVGSVAAAFTRPVRNGPLATDEQ